MMIENIKRIFELRQILHFYEVEDIHSLGSIVIEVGQFRLMIVKLGMTIIPPSYFRKVLL